MLPPAVQRTNSATPPSSTSIRSATLLHMHGLDDNRLTYYHASRFNQLSGKVIEDLIA